LGCTSTVLPSLSLFLLDQKKLKDLTMMCTFVSTTQTGHFVLFFFDRSPSRKHPKGSRVELTFSKLQSTHDLCFWKNARGNFKKKSRLQSKEIIKTKSCIVCMVECWYAAVSFLYHPKKNAFRKNGRMDTKKGLSIYHI
jgi:hypothetical protein